MRQLQATLCVALLTGIPTLAEQNAHREALRPKTGQEMMACGSAFAQWDRWNDYPPHDEPPPEAEQRRAVEACEERVRAGEAARRAALAAPKSRDQATEVHRLKAAFGWSDEEALQVFQNEGSVIKSQDNAAEVERLKHDPAVLATAASAWICWYAVLRTWAKREIDTEKWSASGASRMASRCDGRA